MIAGDKYVAIVKEYFAFLNTEFKYSSPEEDIRGSYYYAVRYKDKIKMVSISYENIENYYQVIVFMLQNGKLPNYDDKTKTLHLNKLNAAVLSKVDKCEVLANNEYFSKFQVENELERKLLKSAKELRLCLNHFDKIAPDGASMAD
jgi:hypothetical protein